MSEPEQAPSRLFREGLKVSFSTPGVILIASSAGFGALAHDAGMPLLTSVFMMCVFFALPGQVVMLDQLARGGSLFAGAMAVAFTGVRLVPMTVAILPLLSDGKPSRLRRMAAAHFIAVTAWLEGMRVLPKHAPAARMTVFLGIGTGLITCTMIGTALGHALVGSVPQSIAAVLLFLTPMYFLVSLIVAARETMDQMAIVIGLMLGPPLYILTPGLDLLLTGLIGGTLAYYAGRHVDGLFQEPDE